MHDAESGDDAPSRLPIYISALSVVATGILWSVARGSDNTVILVAFSLAQIAVISLVIWQACDPFADAAQWIGASLRLPGSVRGATLDAVASSLPELFSGIFFVLLAVSAVESGDASMSEAGGEGYGATVATCAGSAVYNMILIPAFCALFISVYRKEHPTIDVEPNVITRDGMWFLGCQIVLVIFLFQPLMHWWMAVILLLFYFVYICQLYMDTRTFQRARDAVGHKLQSFDGAPNTDQIRAVLSAEGIESSLALIDQIKKELTENEDDEAPESAGVFFGRFDIGLNKISATLIIIIATLVAAIACYWLVEVTNSTAKQLNVPVFFVAVILAAAASSVPDTFLSIGAAKRGDDDGAVSNAFGSNIFDICVCLSVPLLVNCYLNNWQAFPLVNEHGKPLEGLAGIRILLCVLTLITLLIMWHDRRLTRNKAFVLCGLYAIFVAYAVAGSLGLGI